MYKRYCLNNGIKVITEYIPYVNSISVGIWVRSGSRYEDKENSGVSHFIEHMLFKGTKNRTSKEIAEEIEELGGQINAFTGKEATCFYVKMLDEHMDVGIDVLSDMISNPKFSEDDIEKEKSVIQEEISMYEDSPEDIVSDLLAAGIWGEDALSYPVLGTNETIRNMNKKRIEDYFSKKYKPENIVISIAGNFNEEHLLNKLNRSFVNKQPNENIDITYSKPLIEKNILIRNKDIEQVHIAFALPGIELGNENLYTLLLINNIFGGGTSSTLFQKLREEKGYVYTIYSYPSAYKNIGIFNIYLALNEQYIEDAIKLINEEIDKIKKDKISGDKIIKAKEQLKGNYILGLESISSRMFGIGKAELMLGKVYEPKEILKKIDDITKDDIENVIDTVFGRGIYSVSVVGKNIAKDKIEGLVWR